MQVYDYMCRKCGHLFTRREAMSDKRMRDCTEDDCNGKVKTIIQPVNTFFKGGGWADDNYHKPKTEK